MTQILIDNSEIHVSEDLEEVLARLASAKDGIRRADGTITAPPGWIALREGLSGETIYVNTERLGYIRED